MKNWKSYANLICITLGKFKDKVENNLSHICNLLRLSGPPFQRISKEEEVNMEESSDAGVNEGKRNNDTQNEAESSRKHTR